MNKLIFLILLISTNANAVINGKVVLSKDHSYIVNLQNERGNWCSAILIAHQMLITVRRCTGYNKVISSEANIKVERWLGPFGAGPHIGFLNNQIPGKFPIDVNFNRSIGDEVEMVGFGVGALDEDVPSLPMVMRAGRGKIVKSANSTITVKNENIILGPGDRGSALLRINENGEKELIGMADYSDLQSLSTFRAFTYFAFTFFTFQEMTNGRKICGINTSCKNGKMNNYLYPKKWLIAGAFEYDSQNKEISDYKYEPEYKKVLSTDTYQNDKIKWQEFDTSQSNNSVKYQDVFPEATNKISYQVINLESSIEQKIKSVIFQDDGVEVFVNSKKVFSKNEYRRVDQAPNTLSFDVAKGSNQILVKISQGAGGWECHMGFSSQHPISLQTID